MARVIEAVQIFKKVEDVTAAKDDLSPVYIMDELADMARGSVESSEKIADRIAKRLQNKSPVVKYKALRLIRHLINKGCGHFQRFMQRHAELVRSHSSFKGEPDPYKGDTLNQRVRDAGKDAAEALFNTVMAQPVNGLGSRIQGFGSSAPSASSSNHGSGHGGPSTSGLGGGSSTSTSSGSRMVGFGSGTYAAPSAAASNNTNGGGFGGFGFGQKGVNRPLTGGYGADAGSTGPGSSGGHGGGYTAPSVGAVEVLGSEDQLVDSICTPGGLRLAPDPEDLRRFVEAVGSLDGLKVAELLRDKMDASGPWQQQLRALYALEAVLLQGASQACGEVAVMFQSDPGPVQAATAHPQAALRERANRVLKFLLGDDAKPASQAPPAASAPTPAAQQASVDLLGGLGMLSDPPPGSAQPSQPSRQQQSAAPPPGDIFSGLALPAEVPAARQGPAAYHAPGPVPAIAAHPGGYGQQPVVQLHQQQPHSYGQQRGPPAHAPAHPAVVDPFEALPSSSASMTQTRTAYQQPQQPYLQQQAPPQLPPPQQQQPYLQQPPYQHQQQPQGLVGPGQSSAQGPAAGAAARNPGAPLDDMFADMSLSGAPPAASTSTTGAYGSGYVGGGGGVAAAAAATGPYGPQGSLYGAPAVGSNPAGAFPTGNYNVGGGMAHSAGPQAPPGLGPGISGVGTPLGVGTQYAGPPPHHQQQQYPAGTMMGTGAPAPAPQPHSFSQPVHQQQYQPPLQAPPAGAASGQVDLLGGYDLMGSGAMSSGAPGMGYGGTGVVVSAAPGVSSAVGGPAGGRMMVGPGGQVRYIGGSSGQAGPGPAAGMGAGVPGGWQHQPYSAQPPYGAGAGMPPPQAQYQMSGGHALAGPQTQQQQGGAAFDFVMDHFKK